MIPIYDVIKQALVERGWKIDEQAVERRDGELHEFIHPKTGKKMAYLDAVVRQSFLEEEAEEQKA